MARRHRIHSIKDTIAMPIYHAAIVCFLVIAAGFYFMMYREERKLRGQLGIVVAKAVVDALHETTTQGTATEVGLVHAGWSTRAFSKTNMPHLLDDDDHDVLVALLRPGAMLNATAHRLGWMAHRLGLELS